MRDEESIDAPDSNAGLQQALRSPASGIEQ